MDEGVIRVLLIEDNPGDAEMVTEMLSRITAPPSFRVQAERDLSSGLARLSEGDVHIVLLDLGLPDSTGLDALVRVGSEAPDVPVIVFTGLTDEDLGAEIIRRGAQDFLVKGKVGAELLARSIRYAMERNRLLLELDDALWRDLEERERRRMDQWVGFQTTPTVSHLYGETRLRVAAQELFSDVVERFRHLLGLSLEQRAFKVDHNVSYELAKVAEELGLLNCGPADVIDIHNVAMKKIEKEVSSQRLRGYREEGRFALIELMGHLVSFYRRYHKTWRIKPTSSQKIKGENQ